ncbi:MAG: DNRLRE domain-containing protein [Candidatus Margulisiibacteriota bacterium]
MKKQLLIGLLVAGLVLPGLAFWGAGQTCKVTADTWIYQFRLNKNYGDGYGWKDITGPVATATPRIFIGWGGSDKKIGLLKFDLTGLNKTKPVKSASVLLYNCFAGSAAAQLVDVRMITAPWTESKVTYQNRPSAGAVLSTTNLQGSRNYKTEGKWYKFDVTKAAQAWQKGTANNGVMLDPQGDGGVDFEFVCKESAGGAERGPKLEINY